MEKNNITDNELKIMINILNSEIDNAGKTSELNRINETKDKITSQLAANVLVKKVYSFFLFVFIVRIFFSSVPMVTGTFALFTLLRRNQIIKDIDKLKKEYEKISNELDIYDANIMLKCNELLAKETILEYRHGEELSKNRVNNLNIFSFLIPEFQYDLQKINEKYNYKSSDLTIIPGDEGEYILKLDSGNYKNIDSVYQKRLKR